MCRSTDSRVKTTATPKACFVCYKPTNTVLATINTVDFLYTCPVHLTDRNFASPLGESSDSLGGGGPRKMGLTDEEIAKVKEEWEERQKKKEEKEKAKKKEEGEGKGKGKEKEKEKVDDNEKEKEMETTTPGSFSSNAATPPPTTPAHQRFTLHRDFFAMRLSQHRKRRQMVQVKELAPRLPGAPRETPSSIS